MHAMRSPRAPAASSWLSPRTAAGYVTAGSLSTAESATRGGGVRGDLEEDGVDGADEVREHVREVWYRSVGGKHTET